MWHFYKSSKPSIPSFQILHALEKGDKEHGKEIDGCLRCCNVDLTTEEAKDQWATLQLLKRTEFIMDQAVEECQNVDLILEQVAEWSDMVKYTCITH